MPRELLIAAFGGSIAVTLLLWGRGLIRRDAGDLILALCLFVAAAILLIVVGGLLVVIQ